MKARYTYEEIIAIAGDSERYALEAKSCSYLLKNHFNHRKPPSDGEMRHQLRECLSVNGGAFANSGGGLLVFGFADKPSLQPEDITLPSKWGNQSIVDWVGSLLRSSVQPEMGEFDCYLISEKRNPTLLVIDIAESTTSPHQSLDKKYYVRLGNSACPAEHWLVESIRNKARGPQLVVEGDPSSVKMGYVSNDSSVEFEIPIKIRNVGRFMAKDWAIELLTGDFSEARLNDNAFERVMTSSSSERNGEFLKASHPIFPGQTLETSVRAIAKIQWQTDGQSGLSSLSIGEKSQVSLDFVIFAENAPPGSCSVLVDSKFLYAQAYSRLADSNKIRTWGNVLGICELTSRSS